MSNRISSLTLAVAVFGGLAFSVSAHAHTVAGTTAADVALASSVKQALLQVPAFQTSDTDVVVNANDGNVLLSGFVSYAIDVLPARQVAAGVSGVKSISSHLLSWSSETSVPRNYSVKSGAAL